MILNSSDAQIYNNTLVNSMAAIGRTSRSPQGDHFGWHPATGPNVNERIGHVFMNNIVSGHNNYDKPFLFVWQPSDLCSLVNDSQLKQLDFNAYVQTNTTATHPLILWSPAENDDCQLSFNSIKDFKKYYPDFMTNSYIYESNTGPIYKSSELNNFQLLDSFSGIKAVGQIPEKVIKLLGKEYKTIGAYPLK